MDENLWYEPVDAFLKRVPKARDVDLRTALAMYEWWLSKHNGDNSSIWWGQSYDKDGKMIELDDKDTH